MTDALGADNWAQDAVSAARFLLGQALVREFHGERLAGIIVETEAYHQNDPAAHSFKGRTKRTLAMFGPPLHAYIYRSYGLHWCMNVTAGPVGEGAGVLIRALQPIEGIEAMLRNRGLEHQRQLCNGPGKLAQALAITGELYGHDLTRPPLYLEPRPAVPAKDIIAAPRIGISRNSEALLRFYIKDSAYISRK